uniref:EF-hand domain-containing protein n=1 Tax=Leptobrachium leishanense TaxID=445787 RepID=A0A8C5PY45_9ANUR
MGVIGLPQESMAVSVSIGTTGPRSMYSCSIGTSGSDSGSVYSIGVSDSSSEAIYKMSVTGSFTTVNPLTAEECTNRIFIRLDKDRNAVISLQEFIDGSLDDDWIRDMLECDLSTVEIQRTEKCLHLLPRTSSRNLLPRTSSRNLMSRTSSKNLLPRTSSENLLSRKSSENLLPQSQAKTDSSEQSQGKAD